MAKVSVPAKRPTKQRQTRMGRPPRELAGEVEERILQAARAVFLEGGLAGASIDEIARRAHAGKPSIYARFATKEALFEAVITHNASSMQTQFVRDPPMGDNIHDRLVGVGTVMLKRLLTTDTIDFMRLAAAEARRIPKLTDVGRIVREHAAMAVIEVISEGLSRTDLELFPALAPGRIETTVRFFLDLVVSHFLTRALLGEHPRGLRAEIDMHMPRSVAFFLAACRQGAPET